MPGNLILKALLSLPLAGVEALTALLPADLRSKARKSGATILKSVAEVASRFAERAEESSPVESDEESFRKVHVD